MRRLLEADLKRIVVKILPWIVLLIWFVYDTISIANTIGDAPDRSFFLLGQLQGLHSTAMLIIGFAAIFGVYADEFKSMVMIGVIGRGLSRDKFVFGKFLDLCILTILMQKSRKTVIRIRDRGLKSLAGFERGNKDTESYKSR